MASPSAQVAQGLPLAVLRVNQVAVQHFYQLFQRVAVTVAII